MPDEDEEHEGRVAELFALFGVFLANRKNKEGYWNRLEDMMQYRAEWILQRCLKGFNYTLNEAIELLNRKSDELSDEEINSQNTIRAAIDNLVDFSVVEEYQMAEEVMELLEELEEEDSEDEDLVEITLPVFKRYNDRYAKVENSDAQYAMIVAASLAAYNSQAALMYMTMGDERVRPWHRQFEGFTALKNDFPAWLIPPIEHMCRCFLIEEPVSEIYNSLDKVKAATDKVPEMPDWFNPTFKESVALGGRIFSDEHPYFTVDERHIPMLSKIAKRIKTKYFK